LVKGTSVYAEGSPEADPYTNKEGQPAATLRMRVQNIQLLGGNKDNQGANSGNVTNTGMGTAPVVKTEAAHTSAPVDDLPF
jgi:single-stranded DNA-binding protein